MIRLIDLLRESLDNEIFKLKAIGYEIIDKYTSGIYTAFLLYDPKEDVYEIALTSNDQEFTTFQSQIKKSPQDSKTSVISFKDIVFKIKEWLDKYGDLVVGSLNKNRTYKYHQLLKKFGFNVGDISHDKPTTYFPESWNFNIMST
jgi:hypothetical protein